MGRGEGDFDASDVSVVLLRSYSSVYDIKENAHLLYWKSVDHVQIHWSEARTQGKDKMIV